MGTGRWPWRVAGSLLLVAAVAAAGATCLHWLPCRGSMLSGSIFRRYAYGPDFSDACLRRMDGGLPFPYPPEPAEQAPWATELGIAALLAAGLAWLVLVLGFRWSRRTTAIAALPSGAILAVAVVAGLALRNPQRDPDAYLSIWLWASIDVAAVIALVTIWVRTEVRAAAFLRVALVLWGATAFGFLHGAAGYLVMIGFVSDADWDVPPGTGYLTAAALLVAAGLTLLLAGSAGQELQHRGVPLRGVADQDPVRRVLQDDQH